MEGLGINLKLLLAQIVNFLVLLFIFKRFLYKPILKLLDERKKKIEEGLLNAEKINKELAHLEEEKTKILGKVRQEGLQLLKQQEEIAIAKRNEMLARAEEEGKKMVAKALEEIEIERTKMLGEVKKRMTDLAKSMAQKMIEGLDKESQAKISHQMVKEITRR